MPFKIRTKLIVAFLGLTIVLLSVTGIVGYYNQMASREAFQQVEEISKEVRITGDMQLIFERILMPANDYIITGNRKYFDDFKKDATELETLLKEAEAIIVKMEKVTPEFTAEEKEVLSDINVAWLNIKDISNRIFAISNPVGNMEAARLMEEMDYKWGKPAVDGIHKWHELDYREYEEAIESARTVWLRLWIIMGASAVMLLLLGIAFAVFYSGLFVKPIEAIHNCADAIAAGDFKTRLDIKTGDELEQLSNAMNEMAEKLDDFYGSLEDQVKERTKELRIERDLAQTYLNIAGVIFVVIDSNEKVSLVNKKGAEVLGYPEGEIIGKNWFDEFLPERVRDEVRGVFRKLIRGEDDSVEYVENPENPVLTCSGEERFIAWHNTALKDETGKIVATLSSGEDITDRKKAEEKLRQRIDDLEMFRKATIKRELRMEELQRKVDELEKDMKRSESGTHGVKDRAKYDL